MSAGPTALDVLGAWCADASDRHGERAFARARNAVIDTISCIVLGADHEATRAVRRAVARWGGGASAAAGAERLVAAPWAALVNGVAAHAHDFDDHELVGITHPSAVMVPALAALAEERGAGARAVLDAYVVGFEVITRVAQAVNMSLYHRGWHATSTIGTLGAAAACARLLRLGPEAAAAAIGMATSMAAGSNAQFGTTAKPVHAGLAAKSGIVAACLAEAGVRSASTVLDAPRASFLALYPDSGAKGFAEPLAALGTPLAIDATGPVVKLYPCCSFIHRAADGIVDLRREHALHPDMVETVDIATPARNLDVLKFPDPRSETEARFSMQYCAAIVLLTGGLTVADFTPAALGRPAVRALMRRIDVAGHAGGIDDPDTVTIALKDGRRVGKTVAHARGEPELPLTQDDVRSKFETCAASLAPAVRTDLWSSLERFERLDAVTTVMRLLMQIPGAPESRAARAAMASVPRGTRR